MNSLKNRFGLIILGLFLFTGFVFAQEKTITGTITNQDGQPVYEATIKVVGTDIFVKTDADGKYKITVPEGSTTLEISHPEMETTTSTIGFNTTNNVTLAIAGSEDIFEMSLEDLMGIEVTSVSKKTERLQDVPSSMYVITSNDIDRSAAVTLMDLLRENVPGYWAVQNEFDNVDAFIRNNVEGSLLILIDGTPMLEPTHSGFIYRNFDIPLEEIDRIEVIKGSGGTVYGANSATGVINIFTKNPDAKNKISAKAEYAYPGLSAVNLGYHSKFSEKLSVNAYGRFRHFSGFEQLASTEEATPTVQSTIFGGDTTIVNRFTADDNTKTLMTGGFGIGYQLSEKAKISAKLHLNTGSQTIYGKYDPAEYTYVNPLGNPRIARDTLYTIDTKPFALTGNIRFDYSFSDNHGIFTRVSSFRQTVTYAAGGGFNSSNSILDIEIQDNLTLGFNNFSFGANYRFVNFDINSITNDEYINFVEPQNMETLFGAFIQDKITIIEDYLDLYIGLKAENFTLIDNKFYLSPMAKVSARPMDNLTLWGGYTQSYTTPGYMNTNVELSLLKMNSTDFFTRVAYLESFGATLGGGADYATADSLAQTFILSPAGQDSINQGVAAYPNTFGVDVVNGPDIKPSSFQNIEAGFRFKPFNFLSIESNFFYTIIKNGVYNTPDNFITEHQPSLTREGEYADVYYYGNYTQGTNMGLESIIKIKPIDMLLIELSHAWYKSNLEYQENNDFDISLLSDLSISNNDYPIVPEHVVRGKVYLDLPYEIRLNLSGLYATKFNNTLGSVDNRYQEDRQRFEPLLGDDNTIQAEKVGINDSRFILNFMIEKRVWDNKISLFVYGRDILTSPFIESANAVFTPYPKQVAGFYGGGLKLNL